MKEFTTVFTVKIDVHSFATSKDAAEDMNEAILKEKLVSVMGCPNVDGVNILGGHTKETKPIKKDL